MEQVNQIGDEETPIFQISIGQTFKPYAWRASHHMDFQFECLYCDSESLKGYQVEDQYGNMGKIATCPDCERVNAKY
ncbi:hypothetical protein BEP19_00100 [Ammoniphilus oxalaticus]|uniref:Uncharacterized protein n=1 Tax=Ammoniphilus oxalaticus TaxID=66863 RepID=A0A419SRF0_9BACL|nr:hypothetical protein [Ammoniphilus oxalaticus]RKD27014.1 hypothetical protein BEP19_00100 [Ammoniphilus oxalaticus]